MPLTGIISNTARYWLTIAKFIYPTCIRRRNFAKMFSSSSSSSSSRTIYTRHSKSFSGLLVKLEWLGYHMLKKLWWYFIELLHHSRASVPRNKNRERLITVTTVKSCVQYTLALVHNTQGDFSLLLTGKYRSSRVFNRHRLLANSAKCFHC